MYADNEAMQLVKSNRLFDAEKRLRQALYLEPTSEPLQFNLGVVLAQVGQPEEAQKILTALQKKRPESPSYAVALADTFLTSGRRQEAKGLLKEAFRRFKDANNLGQAARVARSISNVSFELGNEEEALCYSYEAYALAPTAEQIGWHGRILVALNQFSNVSSILPAEFKRNPALSRSASAQHALAMARYENGDFKAALAAEESALDFVDQSPEISSELNAAWWLMKQRVVKSDEDAEVLERLEGMRPEVYDFAQRPNVLLTTWPPALRSALGEIKPPSR
jgi:tetratricopeptide (TPR) repeat protein